MGLLALPDELLDELGRGSEIELGRIFYGSDELPNLLGMLRAGEGSAFPINSVDIDSDHFGKAVEDECPLFYINQIR